MAKETNKKLHEPLIQIAKRAYIPAWKAWGIRIIAVVVGFLITGIISTLLTKTTLGDVYYLMYRGTFGRLAEGRTTMLWVYLQQTAILLCLSLAVTPAFKMKFWNCGAEGQALMGGLAAMICMIEFSSLPYPLLMVVIVVTSLLAGAIWGIIPALFKAFFNTNETLFTLMMNYVATQLTTYYIYKTASGSKIIQPVETGNLPIIGGQQYLLNILVVVAIMVLIFIYLKYSKQGYEISVVGESQNTAKYIGINVKKVIIRTMAISGAVCAVAGLLLVSGTDHSINAKTIGGQGFTAIMVSWLGQLNPFVIAIMSALVTFLQIGAKKVADTCFLNSSYADIVSGIVVLFLVGCEFFIRYSVKFRRSNKEAA